MKSKFKDYLLYTLSTIGVVTLFISATTLPQQSNNSKYAFQTKLTAGGLGGAAGHFVLNTHTGEIYFWAGKKNNNSWIKQTEPIN